MPNLDPTLQLQAEMAAVNAVTSMSLVSNAKSASDLQSFQDKLADSTDRVETVKEVLVSLEPRMLTPQLADTLDKNLNRSAALLSPEATQDLDLLTGAESLGFTLMPAEYLLKRRQGCENFLSELLSMSKQVTQHIGINFREAYTLFMESQDNLLAQIDLLDSTLKSTPDYKTGQVKIPLGTRLFNRFKVNGKVDEDWSGNLAKLLRTVTAINTNYLLSSKASLSQLMSYFGGFSGADTEKGLERFLDLPVSVPMGRFRECTYANKEMSTARLSAKQSVELMGGAYFYDLHPIDPVKKARSISEVELFISLQYLPSKVGFNKESELVFPKLGNEIKSLSTADMKAISKQLRQVLQEWRKVFEGTEKYKVLEEDFKDVSKGIVESDLDDPLKKQVQSTFTNLVRDQQAELLELRSDVNSYLVLVVSSLIELIYLSIQSSATE